MSVAILNPSIDDYKDTVVIRGVLDNDSINALNTDFYQRELLPSKSRKHIREAIESGERIPDVVLGMRGDKFALSEDAKTLFLVDPTFIIDGQQRIRTICDMLGATNNKSVPRLGATVHINTDLAFERRMFQALNQYQVKVSPNILLRNNKEDHASVTQLWGLSMNDKQWCLYNRICWMQNMRRQDLMTATTLIHIVNAIHSHIVTGARTSGSMTAVVAADKIVERIGLPAYRQNLKTFFDMIDSTWGIRRIAIKGGAPYMRRTFLEVLARLLSDHRDFWKGPKEQRLDVDYTIRRKLGSFPMDDPEIMRLASAAGAARLTLYMHMLNHINSGKRTKRLVPRKPAITFTIEEQDQEDQDENEVA